VVKNYRPNRFKLTVGNLRKGEWQQRNVIVEQKGHQSIASQKFYRGYPYELQGILSSTGKSLIGKFTFDMWWENFLGISGWGRQRWGIGLSQLYLPNPTVDNSQTTIVDLTIKYNIFPGMHDVDSKIGIMGSVMHLDSEEQTSLPGLGFYADFRAPKILAALVDWVPLFRYPKWIHMDGLYYISPNLTATYSFDLSGRILFRPNFFGTAILSIRQIHYKSLYTTYDLMPSFAGIGVGLKF
jgi:hypothetical protein